MEHLPRATRVHPAGHWPAAEARDTVLLGYDDRHRRRRAYTGEGGLRFLLDLPEAVLLRHGDGLALEGGGIVAVRAAPERLVEVTAEGADALAQLAWHIGNRHLPAEIGAGRILIRDDHVIVAMLRGLGARVRPVEVPFNPVSGAYGDPAGGAHGHGHDSHDHASQGHGEPHHARDHHGHAHGHHGHAHDDGHAHRHGAHDHGHG